LMKQSFYPFLKDFCQIYMDLAGFGNSSVEEILNTQDYANITELFLKQKKLNVCFLGHSFGGKVSTLLAKEKDTLILLSSAGILAKKSLKVRFK
ncbi:alpha/beta hydrolase, partial [Campylobacter jejuni]|nr:alpha/beta hydrolase [Campylobacter jejuni]